MSRHVLELNEGIAMVVTDLHGHWSVYQQLRDRFLEQRTKGQVDRLIICGDLIHTEGNDEHDASLEMLLDVMALQAEFGSDTIVMLLGNHELPHIYGLTLAKGAVQYTPRFEAALARLNQHYRSLYRRKNVIDFLASLPFYVCTRAGVMLTHAGAPDAIASVSLYERLVNIDHFRILRTADQELANHDIEALRRGYTHLTEVAYDDHVWRLLAVSGPDDPRYNDLLRALFLSGQNTDFDLLWSALFAQNELDGNTGYATTVKNFLNYVSRVSTHEQRVLVAGHIGVKDGFGEITPQHLRLASYTHAFPKTAGHYLLLDCGRPVRTVTDLYGGLRRVFPPTGEKSRPNPLAVNPTIAGGR